MDLGWDTSSGRPRTPPAHHTMGQLGFITRYLCVSMITRNITQCEELPNCLSKAVPKKTSPGQQKRGRFCFLDHPHPLGVSAQTHGIIRHERRPRFCCGENSQRRVQEQLSGRSSRSCGSSSPPSCHGVIRSPAGRQEYWVHYCETDEIPH